MAEESSSLTAIESLLGDRYTREARLAPAFLCFFPALLLLVAWFADLQQVIPGLLTLLCIFGVVRWVSHIARGIGDRKEIDLFHQWGGKPTTTMLRSDPLAASPEDPIPQFLLREAQRTAVDKWYESQTGLHLPTQEDELVVKGDPGALDELYEPVVAWLRENSRGNKLVFEENISYGFQRNFFALRQFAIACAIGSLIVHGVAVLALLGLRGHGLTHPSWAALIAATIAIVAYLVGVDRYVREKNVKIQGFAYARQLIYSAIYTNPTNRKNKNVVV